jgi:choline dehydrogenase
LRFGAHDAECRRHELIDGGLNRDLAGPQCIEKGIISRYDAPATVEGARSVGIPTFENPNGRMMEANGGASITDLRAQHGKRQSVFRSYIFPYVDRPNLTVLREALVTRVIFGGKRAAGVEIYHERTTKIIRADFEVVLSLGAINTPKLLLQSGVGDQTEFLRLGIPIIQHLPGVGQNFQDHVAFDCVWEYQEAPPPHNTTPQAFLSWTSRSGLDAPDLFACQAEVPLSTDENAKTFG